MQKYRIAVGTDQIFDLLCKNGVDIKTASDLEEDVACYVETLLHVSVNNGYNWEKLPEKVKEVLEKEFGDKRSLLIYYNN